jgi:hypothetical protein
MKTIRSSQTGDQCNGQGELQPVDAVQRKCVRTALACAHMKKERKIYSRYVFNRGLQTLWKGDAAENGSQFRSIAITSDEFNSTQGIFQVLALQGIGKGIQDGKFTGSKDEPEVLLDQDFRGLDEAGKKFDELVAEAECKGFNKITFMDIIDFEEKARQWKG